MKNNEIEDKGELLFNEFSKYGYTKSNLISQNELILFLNRKFPNKKFDKDLSKQLMEFLGLDEYSTMSIELAISGIIQFHDELKIYHDDITKQYNEEIKLIENIKEEAKIYENEKLNEEGFSENAKLYGEILDINIINKFEEYKELVLKIIFGGLEKIINIPLINEEEKEINKLFEFPASSRADNLEFMLCGKTESDKLVEIGSKLYSLDGIVSQDEFFVGVSIPEKEGLKIAMEIKAKIALRWSNYKYYAEQLSNEEKKLEAIKGAEEETEEKLKYIEMVWSKEQIVAKIKKKKRILDHKFLNQKNFEFGEGKKFVVVLNNIKEVAGQQVQNIEQEEDNQEEENHEEENLEEENHEEENHEEENKVEDKQEEENKEEEKQEEENHEEEKHEEEKHEEENKVEEKHEEENKVEVKHEEENHEEVKHEEVKHEETKHEELKYEEENINLNVQNEFNNEEFQNNYNFDYNQANQETQAINTETYNQGVDDYMFQNSNIVNEEKIYSSVNNAIFNQSTSDVVVQESTLPLQYLPEQINEVIVDNNVKTLPIIYGNY